MRNSAIILLLLLFFSCQNKEKEVRILFTGDILLSRNVKEEYTFRKASPWEDLMPLFKSADIVVGNLEGAVGHANQAVCPAVNAPVFPVDSCDISLLHEAGFRHVTIENNHILDLGKEGKNNTISTLLNNGIEPVSFENSPYFIRTKNIVVSIVAVNTVMNRDSTKQAIPSIELKQKLRLAGKLSNLVVVSIHWGSEFLEWTNEEQREAAKWLIAHGADIIIGSHPHVVQPPELIDGKPVFFSLGNHLFDQKYPATKEGLIAEIVIKNNRYHCSALKTKTKKNSFYPILDGKYPFESKPQLLRALLKISGYTIIPQSIPEKNQTVLLGYKADRMIWNSHPMPLSAIGAHRLDGENEYLFTLERYYSRLDKEVGLRPYVYSVDHYGLLSRWRGSALAWPLLDAEISPLDDKTLCALHRGDSYIMPNKTQNNLRVAAYQWNGFGFKGVDDSVACQYCGVEFQR
jgi:poly-gamma-glutamate synthesis protein (capsule biosynthesis protein)